MAPKKARDRKRQTKLDFSPAAKPSPATRSSAATEAGKSPSKPTPTTTRQTRQAPTKASKRNTAGSSSEDELAAETERGMRLGMPSGTTQHGMFDGENAGASSDSSDGSDEIPHEKPEPIPHKERLATRPSESEEEGEEQLKPKPSSRKRRRAATTSESEPEEPTITVIPRKRQRRTIEIETSGDEEKQKKRSKRRGTRRQSTPEVEVVQVTSQNKRRKASKKAPTPDDDEDELIIQPPSSKRRSTRRRSPSVEDVEEQSPPRSTRRRIARRRSVSEDPSDDEDQRDDNDGANDQVDEEEQDELKEDLAFLRSSPLPDRGRLRSTHDKPKNKRQEALEALKRRRAGTTESSSATPGRKRAVVVETDSESELEVIKEEKDSDLEILDDDDIEDDDDDEEEDREANVLDMFQEDHEDENFIDDNADDIIGEPSATGDLEELRLMNHLSRAKPKELFKHAVEWMVMKKIHPAFESTKIIYTVTFRKLDDEVKGLAGSKFTSSAWTADFLRSIRARPELMIGDISTMERAVMSPHCEACNRSGHTATSELVLTGEPYNPETLEPLADPDDSDSDSDISADSEADLNGEKPAFNAAGERLVPSSHRFVLGSTCKANAQVAHTLHHWRYHLYDWVKDYLKGEGHLTAEKLVKRESRSNRKREKEARKIVDAMESKGEIAKLWRSYKNQVQFALDAQNEYRQGWGRK